MLSEEMGLVMIHKLNPKKPHWTFNIGNKKIIIGNFKDIGNGFKATWRF